MGWTFILVHRKELLQVIYLALLSLSTSDLEHLEVEFEPFHEKILIALCKIGDPHAIAPLLNLLRELNFEVNRVLSSVQLWNPESSTTPASEDTVRDFDEAAFLAALQDPTSRVRWYFVHVPGLLDIFYQLFPNQIPPLPSE